MSYASIRAAFNTYIAGFDAADSDVVYEGVSYRPVEGRGYLQLRMAGYTRRNLGAGPDSLMQETGAFQVSVFRPEVEGTAMADAITDRLAAFFPRALMLPIDAGRFVVVEYGSAMPAVDSGAWINVPFIVNWIA